MLLDFVLPDKVSLEELGTTKKLCITFLLRSGLLFCFNPSSIINGNQIKGFEDGEGNQREKKRKKVNFEKI